MRRARIAAAIVAAAATLALGLLLGAGRAAPPRARATIDGIRCETTEQVVLHTHAHLAIFRGGRPQAVPAGIGIPPPRTVAATPAGPFVVEGSCFYWLHSHTADGVIHIESPIPRTYTLGQYFDIWGRPLGPDRVGSLRGVVTAFVDGRGFAGDPRTIPLTAHGVIQLDVGHPVAPLPYTFAPGL